MQKNIYAVVVTYRPEANVYRNLKQLAKQVSKVIVIDNSEMKNQYLDEIENEKIQIICNRKNLGIAKALNIGIALVKKEKIDWVITLDQDSLITENMIQKMFKGYDEFEEKDKVAMIVPQNIEENKIKSQNHTNKVEEVVTEITSGSIINLKIWNKIGDFEEKLFIDLVDHDICLRIKKKSLKIIKVNEAKLYHNLGATTYHKFLGKNVSTSNHSGIRRYYMMRNRIYVWKRYKLVNPEWIKYDKKMCVNEIVRIILFEKAKKQKIKYIIKGLKDGIGGKFGEYRG